MIRTLSILAMGLLALSYPAFAQTKGNIQDLMKKDRVIQKDGKFKIEAYRLCRLYRPKHLGGGVSKPFQVEARAEAPAQGVISRDNFLVLFTEIALGLRVKFASDFIKGLTPIQALDALQCEHIDAPVGKVDLQVDVNMDKEGIKIEILKPGTGKKQTQLNTWKDLFGGDF
ncbi:MAG: hypothetical protein IH796_11225 [Deltaproteobacteria bacterium]|nr:hypothetical protein [Deltaproteobacteria bacterium]